MEYSVRVKDRFDNEISIKVVDEELIIKDMHIPLEHIYSIQEQENQLTIHAVIKQETVVLESQQATTTLTNVRPKEIEWKQTRFEFKKLSDYSLFVTQLSKRTLPYQHQFSDTKIYCILNPTSGARLAESQWQHIVKPMLLTAGFLEHNMNKVLTEDDGKTRYIAKQLAESIIKDNHQDPYPPIVISMGGDGTLHEIVNGLSDGIQGTAGRFRLAVLPAGSGNAFALGLFIQSIEHGTVKLIQAQNEKPFYSMDVQFGHSQQEDWVNHIQFDPQVSTRLQVVFSWGFHAQIVSKSRYLRYFMGNIRFSLVAKFLLYFLQHYEGELVLKNAKKYSQSTKQFENAQDVVLLDDKKFTYFIVSKQHSLEKGFNIAPFASPLTEDMDVVMLREVDAEKLLNASIDAFKGGVHVNLPDVEYYKTSELYLRVKNKTDLCLDGEIHTLPANGIVRLKVFESSTEQSSFTIFV